MSEERIVTRRDFIRGTTCGALGVAFGLSCSGNASGPAPKAVEGRSKVILIRHADAMDADGNYNGEVLRQMLDEAVVAFFEAEDVSAAWRQMVKPDDILGIKTNVYQLLATPTELEQTMKTRAMEAGVKEENISIRDRGILQDPVFLNATALINTRPLRAHHWSGIGGCLKNYILFVEQPFTYHGDSCADLGALWKLPICAGKTRLNVLVVMRPLIHKLGPHRYDPKHVWHYKGLLVGNDPVALDSVGLELIKRMQMSFFGEEPQGGTSPKHVALAETRHGVGIADLSRIDIVKIGWMEDSLI
jgi:hypothetical protein